MNVLAQSAIYDSFLYDYNLWGFIIIRTGYEAGDGGKFPRVIEKINDWVREEACSPCTLQDGSQVDEETTNRRGNSIMNKYHNIILESPSHYRNISVQKVSEYSSEFLNHLEKNIDGELTHGDPHRLRTMCGDFRLLCITRHEITRLSQPDPEKILMFTNPWHNLNCCPSSRCGFRPDCLWGYTPRFYMMRWGLDHQLADDDENELRNWAIDRRDPKIVFYD